MSRESIYVRQVLLNWENVVVCNVYSQLSPFIYFWIWVLGSRDFEGSVLLVSVLLGRDVFVGWTKLCAHGIEAWFSPSTWGATKTSFASSSPECYLSTLSMTRDFGANLTNAIQKAENRSNQSDIFEALAVFCHTNATQPMPYTSPKAHVQEVHLQHYQTCP